MINEVDYRKLEIRELAEAISLETFPNALVLPETIAKNYKITYSYGHYDDCFDGLLQHRFGKFHIFLNLNKNPDKASGRMRYTFSHELGHYFIDEHRNAIKSGKVKEHPSFNSLVARNPAEKEADYFASCLLMPSKKFKKFCLRKPLSSKLLTEISNNFKTSVSSVVFKYFELSMFPMMIVLSKEGKIDWKMFTVDFKYHFIPAKGAPTPPNTAAGEFFLKGRRYDSEEIVFADDWFTDYNRIKDEQFFEKCYYLSHNKVLSVLWKKEKK
jgi:Zn-dependent peptidase ImmA (M78 family)